MRKLRFLEISDLGDSLEEQERLYVLMPDRPGFRSRLAMNYQRGLFFFFLKHLSTFVSSSGKLRTMTTNLLLLLLFSH